jgi:hypothetical protein
MSSGFVGCASVLFAIACASGCLGPYAHRLDETRAGLIGLDGHDLRACLGVPTDFSVDGELEQQTYRFERDDELGQPFPDDLGAVVISGGRDPLTRSHESDGFPRDPPDQSFCQLDFELERGRVTRVAAQGRTREGMNADGTCLMRAEPCLAYSDGGRAPGVE